MHPELFHIGSFTIYSYGFLILLGIIAAYIYFVKNAKPYGLVPDDVSGIFLWCIVGVFVGGKLFFFLENPDEYVKSPSKMFENPGQGFVFYGSFLFTVPILIWQFRKKQLPVWDMFDIVGVSGALVHAIGKIGCFMAGCCHGKVCHNAMGVVFRDPKSHAEPIGVPLYPVLIIFMAIGIMLFLKRRKQFSGQLFLVYGMVYAIGRFITEGYRGDEERGFLFGGIVSHSQFIAILVFAACAVIYYLGLKNRRISPSAE
jgi:phosphatidylglycerol---prolipoprotein diacylglyceryl transferase